MLAGLTRPSAPWPDSTVARWFRFESPHMVYVAPSNSGKRSRRSGFSLLEKQKNKKKKHNVDNSAERRQYVGT